MAYRFLFLLWLGVSGVSFAQSFRGGVCGGLSVTQLSGDNLAGFNKPGALWGPFVYLEPSARLRVELQMLHFMKGSFDAARPDKGDFSSYSLTLHYVEMPLMLRYFYKGLWIGGGVSGGYLASWKVKNQDGAFPAASPESRDFKPFELSGNLSMIWPLNQRMEIEVRANQSLLPVRNHLGNVVFRLNRGQYNTALGACLRFMLGNGGAEQ